MVERLPFEDRKALLQIETSPFTEGEPEAKKAICPSHTDRDRQQQNRHTTSGFAPLFSRAPSPSSTAKRREESYKWLCSGGAEIGN